MVQQQAAVDYSVQYFNRNTQVGERFQTIVQNYNNPKIDRTGIPSFSGRIDEVFEYCERIRQIFDSRKWPTGATGTPENVDEWQNATIVNVQIDGANGPNYDFVQHAAQAAAADNNFNQPPVLAQLINTWPVRDGITFYDGRVGGTDTSMHANTNHNLPGKYGKYQAQLNDPITAMAWNAIEKRTIQYGPTNTCERTRKFIGILVERWKDQAITYWDTTPNNERPRTWATWKWFNQTREEGLEDFIKRIFIPRSYREIFYNAYYDLQYDTYTANTIRTSSGEVKTRNMSDFILALKRAKFYGNINVGDLFNERQEFYNKVPIIIQQKLRDWISLIGDTGIKHEPTMIEFYDRAITIEVNLKPTLYKDVVTKDLVDYTRVNILNRKNSRNIGSIEYGYNNQEISNYDDPYGTFQQYEVNNAEIQGRFTGFQKKNGKFGGSFQAKEGCFNCGAKDHWANNCPKPKKDKPNYSKSMRRNNSRDRKTNEMINRTRNRNNNQVSIATRDEEINNLTQMIQNLQTEISNITRKRSRSRGRRYSKSRSRSRDNNDYSRSRSRSRRRSYSRSRSRDNSKSRRSRGYYTSERYNNYIENDDFNNYEDNVQFNEEQNQYYESNEYEPSEIYEEYDE